MHLYATHEHAVINLAFVSLVENTRAPLLKVWISGRPEPLTLAADEKDKFLDALQVAASAGHA